MKELITLGIAAGLIYLLVNNQNQNVTPRPTIDNSFILPKNTVVRTDKVHRAI